MADPRELSHVEDPDERILETVLGPSLVGRLYGLLRAVRIYDPSNQTVRDQLREALTLIQEILEDEATLVAMGQCFYVNGTRVRAEPSQIQLFGALTTEFEQRRLGGLRFLEGLEAEELGAFMRLMTEHPDAERGARLAEAAVGAGISRVLPISLEELENAESGQAQPGEDGAAAERDRARKMFRQALHGTRAAVLRTARTGRPAIRRVKRVVHPIVDSIMKNEYSIVGLTAIKSHDEYTYAHSVNVSILSIAIGQTLGLSRATLANLGVGALLHDIGKIAVPAEVLGKPGQLDAAEWDLMRRHPLEGSKLIMRMPGLQGLMLDALGIALYHHVRCDGGGYPAMVRSGPPPSLARIVAVADCYDAMTTHRAYRVRPLTGYEALRTLLAQDPQAFDPAVLWALVQTVGLFPAGTLLQTESGHTVLSLNNDREDLRRPHCRVVAYPDGTHALEGRPEMWEPMPRHETVARVVPPEEFEAEIDRLLAA